jgi:hypothetical protein
VSDAREVEAPGALVAVAVPQPAHGVLDLRRRGEPEHALDLDDVAAASRTCSMLDARLAQQVHQHGDRHAGQDGLVDARLEQQREREGGPGDAGLGLAEPPQRRDRLEPQQVADAAITTPASTARGRSASSGAKATSAEAVSPVTRPDQRVTPPA